MFRNAFNIGVCFCLSLVEIIKGKHEGPLALFTPFVNGHLVESELHYLLQSSFACSPVVRSSAVRSESTPTNERAQEAANKEILKSRGIR